MKVAAMLIIRANAQVALCACKSAALLAPLLRLVSIPVVEIAKANDGVLVAAISQDIAHTVKCLLLLYISGKALVPVLPAHAMSKKPVHAVADVHSQALGVAWRRPDCITAAGDEAHMILHGNRHCSRLSYA